MASSSHARRIVMAASAIVLPMLVTLPGLLVQDIGDRVGPALLYLVSVLGATYLSGMWAGLVASIISVAGFIYFYLPPIHTWIVHGPGETTAVIALPLAAVAGSALLDRLRRKGAEASATLAGSDLRYRALVDLLPAVVTVDELVDGEPVPRFISDRGEETFGFTQDEWLSDARLWRRFVHPEDLERVTKSYYEELHKGEPFTLEYRMIRSDGEVIWVLENTERVIDPSGRVFVQGITFDVTELKRAQEDLQRTVEDLRRTDAERRFLLGRVVHAQEEERSRIASDLHDDPIQKLTAIGLRVEGLAANTPPEHRKALDEVQALVVSTLDRLRRLMFDLRPIALERMGLEDSLTEYLSGELDGTGVGWSVESKLVTQPQPETRVIAYRIAQEALQNVRKHAGAKNVSVAFWSSDGGVQFRIVDDGCGFRVEEGLMPKRGHLGLIAMQERAELAGGRFSIRSEPGEGTSVEFWIPLTSAPPILSGAPAATTSGEASA